MKKVTWFLLGVALISGFSIVEAESVLDVRFNRDGPVDQAAGVAMEARNVVLVDNGGTYCGEFDGGSALVVPEDPRLTFGPTDPFWAEMWLNPLNVTESATLLVKGTGTNYSVVLSADGSFSFSYYSRGEWRTVTTKPGSVPLETWSHLAVFFDPSTAMGALFVNGKVAGLASDLPPFQSGQEMPLFVGGKPAAEDSPEFVGFDGEMAEVRLAKENLKNLGSEFQMGEQAFAIKPLF